MINTFLILLLGQDIPLSNYKCTSEQLKVASEVFKPCMGEKHFKACYEASIREYCEINLNS